MNDRTDEPRRSGPDGVTDEPRRPELDLDTSTEPEPDWAEAIRRGRRERGERLRRLFADAPAEPRPDGDVER